MLSCAAEPVPGVRAAQAAGGGGVLADAGRGPYGCPAGRACVRRRLRGRVGVERRAGPRADRRRQRPQRQVRERRAGQLQPPVTGMIAKLPHRPTREKRNETGAARTGAGADGPNFLFSHAHEVCMGSKNRLY